MYYVYMYQDPVTELPFYVGKGKGDRALDHLKLDKKRDKQKTRFYNKIEKLLDENQFPIISLLVDNIVDEQEAYRIEEVYILAYGRKGYEENGILLNTCLGSNPPNHKGKTYKDLFGDRWEEVIEERRAMQLADGGWGPDKHSEETLQKMKERKDQYIRRNEETLLQYGKQFCEFFNYRISSSKWYWWTKHNKLKITQETTSHKKQQFGGKSLFEMFIEKFNAKIVHDSMLWFHNPINQKSMRCFDWEYDLKIKDIPENYVRGRGKFTMKPRKKG